eukprot:gnl/MRDRNA2_/MRDRNA2_92582_c0_seq1.p1 gnl/MRDRNA2_/MRDRNA2_92582_c0~~gnl/MRDRNA2_/MRDRNA2_92582_c0_seq1.p1  ORF type:complete len:142 (-),score=27.78 gnl/MRDRNA2_/MRDRNA2_92582_c0_seq1:84-509(-)
MQMSISGAALSVIVLSVQCLALTSKSQMQLKVEQWPQQGQQGPQQWPQAQQWQQPQRPLSDMPRESAQETVDGFQAGLGWGLAKAAHPNDQPMQYKDAVKYGGGAILQGEHLAQGMGIPAPAYPTGQWFHVADWLPKGVHR